MSDRQRVRQFLAGKALGNHMWLARTLPRQHMCRNAPECGLPEDNHEAAKAVEEAYREADRTYVSVIDRVDWNRVLMLAASRHQHMLKKYPDQHLTDEQAQFALGVQGVCGDCINQAAMLDDFGKFGWPEDLDTPSRDYDPAGEFR